MLTALATASGRLAAQAATREEILGLPVSSPAAVRGVAGAFTASACAGWQHGPAVRIAGARGRSTRLAGAGAGWRWNGSAWDPDVRGVPFEGRLFVLEARRASACASEPSRPLFELRAQLLRSAVFGRVHVNSPRAMGIDPRGPDGELGVAERDRGARLVGARRERAHEHALLRPGIGHHDDRAPSRGRGDGATKPFVDDADTRHVPSITRSTAGVVRRA